MRAQEGMTLSEMVVDELWLINRLLDLSFTVDMFFVQLNLEYFDEDDGKVVKCVDRGGFAPALHVHGSLVPSVGRTA